MKCLDSNQKQKLNLICERYSLNTPRTFEEFDKVHKALKEAFTAIAEESDDLAQLQAANEYAGAFVGILETVNQTRANLNEAIKARRNNLNNLLKQL